MVFESPEYYLGIDPGWKNVGLSIVSQTNGKLRLEHGVTLNPSSLGLYEAVEEVRNIISTYHLTSATIERYVSYANVTSTETENILMYIGGIVHMLGDLGLSPSMYRAIDWKTELVKLLVRNKDFDNPSTSLDKKFSLAAASACLDGEGDFPNDHIADSTCLASIGFLKSRYTKAKGVSTGTIIHPTDKSGVL